MTTPVQEQNREALTRLGFGYLASLSGAVFPTPVSVSEALVRADLDWEVQSWDTLCTPAAIEGADKADDEAPRHMDVIDAVPMARTLMRVNKNGSRWPLAVVGTRYRPLQNHDAFDFAVNLVQEYGAEVVAAGCEGKPEGRNTFMALRVPRALLINDEDVIECYVLLRAAHGDAAMSARVVPVQKSTGTELSTDIDHAPQSWSITHSGDIAAKLREAEHVMRMVENWAIEFESMTSRMLQQPMGIDKMRKFAEHVLPTPRGAGDRAQTQWAQRRAAMVARYESTKGGFGEGTIYAAFTAANYYIDRETTTSAGNDAAKVRAERTMNGEARKLKHRAWAWIERNV